MAEELSFLQRRWLFVSAFLPTGVARSDFRSLRNFQERASFELRQRSVLEKLRSLQRCFDVSASGEEDSPLTAMGVAPSQGHQSLMWPARLSRRPKRQPVG
jgi:hypothetical protein